MNIGPILFIYRTTSDLNFIEINKVLLANLVAMEINNIIPETIVVVKMNTFSVAEQAYCLCAWVL
jgi:hypothetical protein